jgi:hypothetical protein
VEKTRVGCRDADDDHLDEKQEKDDSGEHRVEQGSLRRGVSLRQKEEITRSV